MNKPTFLVLSIAAIALLVIGSTEKSSVLSLIGYLVELVTWVLGIVKMVQLKRWGWLVAVILLTPLATLLYGIFGPSTARGGLVA